MEPLQVHDVAGLFPPMDADQYAELVQDIEENGLREPIWTHQGQIIDGRHRYRACRELGIEPTFREWNGNGSLIGFVVSLNLKRRHLSPSQRAAIAVEMLPVLEAEAKERQRGRRDGKLPEELFPQATVDPEAILPQGSAEGRGPQSRDIAAKAAGVNSHYISDAKRLKDQAPEVFQMVRDGRAMIAEAQGLANLPELVRARAVEEAQRDRSKPVREIVRAVRREERLKAEATGAQILAVVGDPKGEIARAGLAVEWYKVTKQIQQELERLDPDVYVPILEEMDHWLARGVAQRVREWADRVERAIDRPMRLVKGGRDA